MTAPTPAVERAARAVATLAGGGDVIGWDRSVATLALTTALTDPGDPDSLARTLWFLHKSASGWGTTVAAFENTTTPGERERWREVADGLRMMLAGSGS